MKAVEQLIQQLNEQRRGSRPDVAHELREAMTNLEIARWRMQRAELLNSRNPHDAAQAVQKLPAEVLVEDEPVEETTEKEVKSK